MMYAEREADLLSSEQRHLWRLCAPSIWTFQRGQDSRPEVSILRTLFDQPRWLEAYHLYDARGSELFERICELPEYYLTRTENAILSARGAEMIAAAPVTRIVELGSGSARKTAHLLREQVRQRGGGLFAPLDVSLSSLVASRDHIARQFSGLDFLGLQARFEDGVAALDHSRPTLFAFLGSTIGNFTRAEFIRFFDHLSAHMAAGDFLLLGVDGIKDKEVLERAYADAQGVTAEFILNVFHNINRIAGSNFDLAKMRYDSRYNTELEQVEMYAVSTARQEIRFPAHGASFVWPEGDRIMVEISRKFDPLRLEQQLGFFGLRLAKHFTDPRGWFSLLLLRKSGA